MNIISDQSLFYGGLAVAAGAAVLLLVLIVIFIIRKIRLEAVFDVEYGKKYNGQNKD